MNRAYLNYIKYYKRQFGSNLPTVEKYIAWLEGPNPSCSEGGRPWCGRTQHAAHCAVRKYFREELGENYHPILLHKVDRGEAEEYQRSLTTVDYLRIQGRLDTATPKGKRDSAILALMFDTGMRASELCGLTLDNLHMYKRQCKLTDRKNGKDIMPVFSALTRAKMEAWLSVRSQAADPDEQHVFVGIGGRTPGMKMTSHGLRAVFRDLGNLVGIKLSPHDLRRGFASQAHRNGAPRMILRRQGGWEDDKQVDHYIEHGLIAEDFDGYYPTLCEVQDDETPIEVEIYA